MPATDCNLPSPETRTPQRGLVNPKPRGLPSGKGPPVTPDVVTGWAQWLKAPFYWAHPVRTTACRRCYACLVSQKILEISSILASSWSAVATSSDDFVPPPPPASLVASLKSWCSWGYFSKCGGLK